MANTPKYYIVEASALPEIFLKVAEAKHFLATGQAATVNDAAKMTGISRSAFYKYRDALLPFQNMTSGRIITFQLLLHDKPGMLQSILGIFSAHNANIITINSIRSTCISSTVPSSFNGRRMVPNPNKDKSSSLNFFIIINYSLPSSFSVTSSVSSDFFSFS